MYFDAALILNLTVEPGLTLIAVAKPWMLSLPAREMSHSVGSLPGLLFSHAIALPVEHGSLAADADETETVVNPTADNIAATTTPMRRRRSVVEELVSTPASYDGLEGPDQDLQVQDW